MPHVVLRLDVLLERHRLVVKLVPLQAWGTGGEDQRRRGRGRGEEHMVGSELHQDHLLVEKESCSSLGKPGRRRQSKVVLMDGVTWN